MVSLGNSEIIQIAESVAREKGINMDLVLTAMEDAIEVAGRRKYGHEQNIKAEINKKSGEVKLFRVIDVVEEPENLVTEISLDDANERNPGLSIGDQIMEPLPPIDLGRVAAQSAKQIIIQKVRDAEREKQYEDFKDRSGEILGGIVKRIEFGDIVVDLGRTEAVIKRDQQIKSEMFKVNDRIRAYVYKVERLQRGPQIFLSRTHNDFLAKLMELEIPEVYEGQIEIKAIARDPGSKAKVAVYSTDPTIDYVGSCIGMKGNRIKAVTNELSGEKIDVISWSGDLSRLIINAMTPAEISKVVIHEDRKAVETIVTNEQFSLAVGRRGQNVRLASQLTGWHIEIMTDEQESKRRVEEFKHTTDLFTQTLDIDEMSAQILVSEGYSSIEQIASSDAEVIESIESFDQEFANKITEKANMHIASLSEVYLEQLEHQGVEQELLDMLGLPLDQLLKMAENGIKTIEDLAELNVREFREILPDLEASNEDISAVIEVAKQKSAQEEKES